MTRLHLEKIGIRGLAIAESFRKGDRHSVLAGVVMRKDMVVDGFVLGKSTLLGNDATSEVLQMITRLGRKDINYLLLAGTIISLYNIVDIKKIFNEIKIPVIGVSHGDSSGIEVAIKKHFPSSFESVIKEYKNLPTREKIPLYTKKSIYARWEGCSKKEVKELLDSLTIHGSTPEPIRVARLLSRAVLIS